MLTAEQHAIRREGVSGSEIAAVAGLSPWSGPINIWRLKRGLTVPDDDNHHLERGTYLESGLLRWYAKRFDRQKIEQPGTLVHPKHKIVIATPDAVADSELVVEIKAPHWRTAADWGTPGTDEIPDYYVPQVIWEMAVTGVKKADVIAFIDGDIKGYHLKWDQTLFDVLLEQAERFWRDYVMTGREPPEDGSVAYSDYLAQRFPRSDQAVEVTDDPSVVRMVEDYKAAAAAMDAAEERKRLARQRLEKHIGNQAGLKGTWGSISFKHNRDSLVVDFKALCDALNPPAELLEKFTKPRRGPRVFRPYLKKKEQQ